MAASVAESAGRTASQGLVSHPLGSREAAPEEDVSKYSDDFDEGPTQQASGR